MCFFFNVCISMHIWSLGTKMTKILSTLGSYHLVRTIHIWHWYKTEWNKCWLKEEPLILVGNEGGCNENSSIWAVPWREKAFFPKGSKGEGENQTETCMRKGNGVQCALKTPSGFVAKTVWGGCGRLPSWAGGSRSWSTLIDIVKSHSFILWATKSMEGFAKV